MADKKTPTPRRRDASNASDAAPTTTRAALIPQQEQTVDFYGDGIPVAQGEDGMLYVALHPITDYLGLFFSAQRRRVLRDEVMAERLRTVLMTASDGRRREQLCLPLDLLPGFLFGVTPSQAKPEIVEKLKRYRAECFRVLWRAFSGEAGVVSAAVAPVPAAPSAPADASALALEHIEQMALAIATMARQQRAFEQQMDRRVVALEAGVQERHAEVMGRLDQAAAVVGTLLQRMSAVETVVAPGQVISDAQAAEISALIKAIAAEITARDRAVGKTGRNAYQAVFGELYRRFRVPSYHNIPLKRFGDVMAWLREYQETLDAHGDDN